MISHKKKKITKTKAGKTGNEMAFGETSKLKAHNWRQMQATTALGIFSIDEGYNQLHK